MPERQGRRLEWEPHHAAPAFAPGDYCRDPWGTWWIRPPDGNLGSLRDHRVTEHDDGTISVHPSIVQEGVWHGYIERGVWRW